MKAWEFQQSRWSNHRKLIANEYRSGDKFHDISAIDSRLAELEQEEQRLIALRKELQKPKPASPISDSFSPEQKIAIWSCSGIASLRIAPERELFKLSDTMTASN